MEAAGFVLATGDGLSHATSRPFDEFQKGDIYAIFCACAVELLISYPPHEDTTRAFIRYSAEGGKSIHNESHSSEELLHYVKLEKESHELEDTILDYLDIWKEQEDERHMEPERVTNLN
jgi:hypothetical protein